MTHRADFLALGDERFISLTTYRRSGALVSTPVWVARDGDSLIVTTPAGSGKVKRLRNDGRVIVQPCNRFGKVKGSAVPLVGEAEVLSADEEERVAGRFRDKYGLEYQAMMAIERVARRGDAKRLLVRMRAA